MIEYRIGDNMYVFSYSELRQKYLEFVDLKDEDFINRLPEAAHLACIISWLKEYGQWAVSDIGIVHELIHLMHIPDGNTKSLREIRDEFKTQLLLA